MVTYAGMSHTHPPLEVTVWAGPEQTPLVREVLSNMGTLVRPIGVGGVRSTEVRELAQHFECGADDDFRKMLVDRPAAFVLMTTMDQVNRSDLEAALAQGSTVLTTEPVATGFEQLVSLRPRAARPNTANAPATTDAGHIIHVPAFKQMPGWTTAVEPLEVISTVRLLSFASLGRANECSLFARLCDAWEVVLGLTTMPESIDASLVGQPAEVPDNPRELTGHLAAHARMPGRCAAVLEVSDSAGPGFRRAHVVGDKGQFHVGDRDFKLLMAGGGVVDEKPLPTEPASFAQLIAIQWRQLIERPNLALAASTGSDPNALACALACLLSARTGEPEAPGKLLAMQSL